MNFYFCETCGKRVTEKDIADGRAKNKQLKGVYCVSCAVGVMTMEMDAISDTDIRKSIRRSSGNNAIPQARSTPAELRIPGKPSTSSNPTLSAQRRGEARSTKPAIETSARAQTKSFAAALGGVSAVTVLVALVLLLGSKPHETAGKNSPPAPQVIIEKAPLPTPAVVEPRVVESPAPAHTPAIPETPSKAKVDTENEVAQVTPTPAPEIPAAPVAPPPALPPPEASRTTNTNDVPATVPVATSPSAPSATPATTAATATAPGPDQASGLQKILKQSLSLLGQADVSAAQRFVAQDTEASEDARAALTLALATIRKRETAWREALGKRVGQNLHLETKSGVIDGALQAADSEGLKIDKPLILDGAVKGSATVFVAFADIQRNAHDGVPPTTVEEWLAQSLQCAAKSDFDAADAALTHCDGQLLQAPLKGLYADTRTSAREVKAEAAWKDLATRMAGKISQSQAKALLLALSKFETDFAETAFIKNPDTLQKLSDAKEDMNRAQLGLDPRIAQLFKGKITAYEPRTQRITVVWDLSVAVKDDFEGSESNNKVIFNWLPKGLFLYNCYSRDALMQIPQFMGEGASIKFDYKNLTMITGGSLGFAFYGNQSKATSPQIMALVGKASGIWDMKADGFTTQVNLAADAIPKDGTLEASLSGKHITTKCNGKVLFEGEAQKANDHAGLGIGGGHETTLTMTRLEVSARLDPAWLAKKLDALSKH